MDSQIDEKQGNALNGKQMQPASNNQRSNLFGGALTSPNNNNNQQRFTTKSKLILPTAFWALLLVLGFCIILLLSSLNHTLKSLDTLIRSEKSNAQNDRDAMRLGETLASWMSLPVSLSLDNALASPKNKHPASSIEPNTNILVDKHEPQSAAIIMISDGSSSDIRHEEMPLGSDLLPEHRSPHPSYEHHNQQSDDKLLLDNNNQAPFVAYVDHMNVNINTGNDDDNTDDNADISSRNQQQPNNEIKHLFDSGLNQDSELSKAIYDYLVRDILTGNGDSPNDSVMPSFQLDGQKFNQREPISQILMFGSSPMSPMNANPFSTVFRDRLDISDKFNPFMSQTRFPPALGKHGSFSLQQEEPVLSKYQQFGNEHQVHGVKLHRPAPYEAALSYDQMLRPTPLSPFSPFSSLISGIGNGEAFDRNKPTTFFTTIIGDSRPSLSSGDSVAAPDELVTTGGVMMFEPSSSSDNIEKLTTKPSINEKMQSLAATPQSLDGINDFFPASTLSSLMKMITTNTEPNFIFPNAEQKSKLSSGIKQNKLDDKVQIIDPSGSLLTSSLSDLLSLPEASAIFEPESISLDEPLVDSSGKGDQVASLLSDMNRPTILNTIIDKFLSPDGDTQTISENTQTKANERDTNAGPLFEENKDSINLMENNTNQMSTSAIMVNGEEPVKVLDLNESGFNQQLPAIDGLITAAQSTGSPPPTNVPGAKDALVENSKSKLSLSPDDGMKNLPQEKTTETKSSFDSVMSTTPSPISSAIDPIITASNYINTSDDNNRQTGETFTIIPGGPSTTMEPITKFIETGVPIHSASTTVKPTTSLFGDMGSLFNSGFGKLRKFIANNVQ